MSAGVFLGGGVGYRRPHRAALLGDQPGPEVLELMPEHVFAAPEEADALAARYPLVLHAVGLSIGTAFPSGVPDAAGSGYLARVAEIVRRTRPRYISDHVALTRSPSGVDVGHLLPVPYTDDTLAVIAARVRALADALAVPVLVENIARPFTFGAAEMPEAEFFGRLVAATGCGLLLDLTNHLYNARNLGFDARATLAALPLEAVRVVHLAGGVRRHDGFWVDSHSRPLDDDSLALLPVLRGRAPLEAIIVERDSDVPSLADLVAEAARAAALWRG